MNFLSPLTSRFDRAGMNELAGKMVRAAKVGDEKKLSEAIENLSCLVSIEGDKAAFDYLGVAESARDHLMASRSGSSAFALQNE